MLEIPDEGSTAAAPATTVTTLTSSGIYHVQGSEGRMFIYLVFL